MRWIVVAAMIVLAALTPAQGAKQDPFANVHSIAVISAMGDVDMRHYDRTGHLGTHYRLHTDWNLDGEIADAVAKALGARFTIVHPAIPQDAFAGIDWSDVDGWVDLHRRLQALPKTDGVDAYVVVFPEYSNFAGTEFIGLNVANGKGLFGGGNSLVGAWYYVGIYDAATLNRLDYATGGYPSGRSIYGFMRPTDECPVEYWAESPKLLTPDMSARLHREMTSLFSRTIAHTLARANLISKADAETATAAMTLAGDPACKPF